MTRIPMISRTDHQSSARPAAEPPSLTAGRVPTTTDRTQEGLPMIDDRVPRGPGLFEVARVNGQRAVTNIRRLAGREYEPRPGRGLINSATVLLGVLGAGLFAVSLAAQYRYVFVVKHQAVPAMIEAIGLDAAMIVFSLLGLGLARAGQSAYVERVLIIACSSGSAAMNYAAATGTSWRSVAAYVMPPILLAVVVDRVIAVVRRHILGDSDRSAWIIAGRLTVAVLAIAARIALYLLRLVLAPASTSTGLRRWVLIATPLPEVAPRPQLPPADGQADEDSEDTGGGDEDPDDDPDAAAAQPGETKKAHLLRLYKASADYGDRRRAAAAATSLAQVADLSPGTARNYVNQHLDELESEAS
jgi:hypothetical protein